MTASTAADDAAEIAILGGTGFIGRHLVDALRRDGRRVRLLVRDEASTLTAASPEPAEPRVTVVRGSLDDAASLERLIVPGSAVINLAWSGESEPSAIAQARALAAACRAAPARVLVHGSTAMVMGPLGRPRVNEDEPPAPRDGYGRAKLAVERTLARDLGERVPLAIARPTAVFGAGGANLIKLAAALSRGPAFPDYLRSCLFDRRLLHLVPVESVVSALRLLAARPREDVACYFVSADDESPNTFRDVEQRLLARFGLRDHALPRVPLPAGVLRLLLRLRDRSQSAPFTVFDNSRLRSLGFVPPIALGDALDAFASWFQQHGRQQAEHD